MSASESPNLCPQCHAPLRVGAAVCSACGYQFSASALSAVSAAPGGVAVTVTGARPGGVAVTAPPRRGRINKIVMLVVAVGVLVGGTAGWFLYLNPGRCAGPLFDRHDLPDAIPLPAGCTFQTHSGSQPLVTPNPQAVFSNDAWTWMVDGSDPAAIGVFYGNAFAEQGWKDVQSFSEGLNRLMGACKGNQYLSLNIVFREPDLSGQPVFVAAPTSGTLLNIQVLTAENPAALVTAPFPCSG